MKVKTAKVLGVKVARLNQVQVEEMIAGWIEKPGSKGLRQVVTAYSEFMVRALKDQEFRKTLMQADLVVPDGQGVLAAMEYGELGGGEMVGKLKGLVYGLMVGRRGLKGANGEVVTGVWLFERLVKLASERGWKVFMLGGWNKVAEELANKLKLKYPSLKLEYDEGEIRVGENSYKEKEVIKKINKFEPEVLFVAYGPVVQEKWIRANRKKLKARVAIGVGGTFDEVSGRFKKTPQWLEEHGLKALWRLIVQPKRIKRVWRAMAVFPWLVYRERVK